MFAWKNFQLYFGTKVMYKIQSARELENEELKSAIKRIYKENKGIYGAPRIHYILGIEGFNVSLKRVQRRMTELGLCAITVKKIQTSFK